MQVKAPIRRETKEEAVTRQIAFKHDRAYIDRHLMPGPAQYVKMPSHPVKNPTP